MPYIGAGIQRFNTADGLTVNGNAEVTGTSTLTGAVTASGGATLSSSSSGEFNALTISQADNTSGNESRIRFKRTTDAGSDREVAAIVADRLGGNDTDLVFETNTDGSDGAVEKMRLSHLGILSIDQLFGLGDTDTGIALGANGANITQFYTANNERLRIAADGKVGVNTTAANLQMSVNFDSSAVAGLGIHDTNSGNLGGMLQFYSGSGQGTLRGNIQNANNAGIHVNVGTGSVVFTQTGYTAANALDDYEEGTFTPEIRIGGSTSGITNNSQVGQYTKIGRMVTLTGRVSISNKGSNSGAMTIAGMPFASQNTSNLESIGSVELQNMSSGTDNLSSLTNNNVHCRVSPNVLTIEMRRTMIGANDITNVQMSDSTVVSFTITYFT